MKFKIIEFDEINSICSNPFSPNELSEYINGGRQDVLYNTDIFCENVRSINKIEKDFSIFERVDYIDDTIVLVFSIYLELFEYRAKISDIYKCIDYYSTKYPNNIIVFSWNHDYDFSKNNNFVSKYNNVVILNYNTSIKSKNDIIIPFWSMNTTNTNEIKDKFCSFVGTDNNQLRLDIHKTFINRRLL